MSAPGGLNAKELEGSTLRLNVVLDFPSQSTVLSVTASTTYAELLESIATALGLTKSDSKSADSKSAKSSSKSSASASASASFNWRAYTLTAVAFQRIPRDITDSKQSADLKSLDIADRTTIIVNAPLSSKPKKFRAGRKEKEEKEKDGTDGKKKGSGRSANDYAGLNPKNILTKWLAAETGTKKKTICFEFIEGKAHDVFKQKGWTDLKREQVASILKSDKINVKKEAEVLDAAVAWAKAELKRDPNTGIDSKTKTDEKESTGAQLTRAMGKDILHAIRFPLFDLNDVAIKLSPLGILDQNQTLALFTYLGQKAACSGDQKKIDKLSLDSTLKGFIVRPRDPRWLAGRFPESKILTPAMEAKLSEFYTSNGGKLQEWELLYRGTRDGWGYTVFWGKVPQYDETWMIVKEQSGQRVFGGFTPLRLVQNSTWMPDTSLKTFVFQLNSGQERMIRPEPSQSQYAIHTSNFHWGHSGSFYFSGTFQSGVSAVSPSYPVPGGGCLAGNSNFTTAEIEVYGGKKK
jgi:hypothetical protein